jgi:methionine synthase II (cobalamin-independent)
MFQIPLNSTAMIGSLPYAEAEEALKALGKAPLGIPTWPQLPKRSFKEGMIVQYSQGFPGIRIDEEDNRIWVERDDELLNSMSEFYEKVIANKLDEFSISSEYAQAFPDFLAELSSRKEKPVAAKGQVVGPFTLGLGLSDSNKKAVWFDEQYRDVVLKGLAKKALWQVKEIQNHVSNVVIFFDEPILSALGTPAYIGISDEEVIDSLNEVAGAVQEAGAAVGIHCCGNMDWPLLTRTSIDIISFDAYEYGEKLTLYPDAVESFLQRGGILAWGIVPTGDGDVVSKVKAEDLREKILQLKDLFAAKGVNRHWLDDQAMLTPACGMGTLSAGDSERVLSLLHELGKC